MPAPMRRYGPAQIYVVEDVGRDRADGAAVTPSTSNPATKAVQVVVAVDLFLFEPPRTLFIAGTRAGGETKSYRDRIDGKSRRLVGLVF